MPFRPRRLFIQVSSLIVKGLCRLLGGFRAEGLEHLPESGAAILASNHLSWADPPAIRAVVRRSCWFMANDFLFRIPLLGRLIPLWGGFPVTRGRVDREALKQAETHLKAGDLLCVFPEGGTSLSGKLVPFEGGVALLALRADVPIIPVALTGTDKVLPITKMYPHFARGGVTLRMGPPLHPADIDPSLPRRERVDRLTERLHAAIAALLPPDYLPDDLLDTRPDAPPPVRLATQDAAGGAEPRVS